MAVARPLDPDREQHGDQEVLGVGLARPVGDGTAVSGDAFPVGKVAGHDGAHGLAAARIPAVAWLAEFVRERRIGGELDRKSTRLNSSHVEISYAVFCL